MNKPVSPAKPATSVPAPAPVDPRLVELEQMLLDLIGKNETQTAQWEGSNAQFNATRIYLAGQREILTAIAGFLQGDQEGMQKLLEA